MLPSAQGLGAEVRFDHVAAGLDRASVINADGLHTVAQSTLERVCAAVSYALGR